MAVVIVGALPLSTPASASAMFVQQAGKLTGTGEIGAGAVGASVALSADGNTALIGGELDNGHVGAAWVFTRSGESWTQQGAKLTGGEETGAGAFGSSVALSSDGNTALIGGAGDNGHRGAAWVFTRSGGTWTQQGGKLTGAGATAHGAFGFAAALSADGNTALVGGPGDNGERGAAWAFTRSGSTWTQQGAKLTASKERGRGSLGFSVALSADGNTALMGAPGFGRGGAAYVFTRTGSTWAEQGRRLKGSGRRGPTLFGWSVALAADGNTGLIGGPGDHGHGTEGVGAAWVFTRTGSTWSQQGPKLTGAGEVGLGEAGWSVALAADGDTALIGAAHDNGRHEEGPGAAWIFTRTGSVWSQDSGKLTGNGEVGNGAFGLSAAMSADANTALIGAPLDNGDVGAAWVFVP